MARTRIPHQLRVPAPDRFEHDADEAWRRGPLAALDRAGPARCRGGRGHGDGAVPDRRRRRRPADHAGAAVRRQPGPGAGRSRRPCCPRWGRRQSFCAGRSAQAPGAAGYWPATAVANHALAGEAVIDNATASTAYPLFDGTGWSEAACADMRRDRRPHAAGRGDRHRRRAGADADAVLGGGCGRRPVRAAGRRRRPRRRRARAVRHDADRVDDDPGIP